MNRTLAFSLLVAVAALAPAGPAAGQDADPDTEAAVRAFAQEWVAAFNAHDAEAYAALYADGAVLVWPDGAGTVVEDRAAFAQGSAAFHAQARDARLDLTPAHVRLLGADAAVVTLEGTARFAGEPQRGHMMLVLERAADGWRVAGEHGLMVEDQ